MSRKAGSVQYSIGSSSSSKSYSMTEGDLTADQMSATFPRRSSRKGLSLTQIFENKFLHKALKSMQGRHVHNVTISSGMKPLLGFVRWKAKAKQSRTPPGVIFRRYIKLAVICIKLCKTSYESVAAARGEFLSVFQYSAEFETEIDKDGLVFDPSDFKAKKEGKVSEETKRILRTRQAERTSKDIEHLMVALKSIQSFKDYPRNIQEKLCQVGWYETFESKRAIIRQGHPPRSFYFILTGSVMVTKYDRKTQNFETLVVLHQGMSFGELAVITRSVRQATVSTQTTVELLCISADDFKSIFMSGTFKSVTDTERNTFIRNVGFLKHFPIHILAEEANQNAYMFHYFHRGQILVRDSNNTDWIYIVKSGSVSVLKKLEEAKPNLQPEEPDLDEVIGACESANDPSRRDTYKEEDLGIGLNTTRKKSKRATKTKWRSGFCATVDNEKGFKDLSEMDTRLADTLPGYRLPIERLRSLDYESIIQEHRARLKQQPVHRLKLPIISSASAQDELSPGSAGTDSEADTNNLPLIRKTSKGAYLAITPSTRKRSREEQKENDMKDLRQRQEMQRKAHERSLTNRKTAAEELDNRPVKETAQTVADLRPMFIEVQVLERGQYFGVSNLIYPDQPNLSLVSNGAECIMISKKFFMEHANTACMNNLRMNECPYPPTEEMQRNLQDYVNWEAHRAKIYERLMQQKQLKFRTKKSFIPQYVGQYSHRTGPV